MHLNAKNLFYNSFKAYIFFKSHVEETFYLCNSLYLVSQYSKWKRGGAFSHENESAKQWA